MPLQPLYHNNHHNSVRAGVKTSQQDVETNQWEIPIDERRRGVRDSL